MIKSSTHDTHTQQSVQLTIPVEGRGLHLAIVLACAIMMSYNVMTNDENRPCIRVSQTGGTFGAGMSVGSQARCVMVLVVVVVVFVVGSGG